MKRYSTATNSSKSAYGMVEDADGVWVRAEDASEALELQERRIEACDNRTTGQRNRSKKLEAILEVCSVSLREAEELTRWSFDEYKAPEIRDDSAKKAHGVILHAWEAIRDERIKPDSAISKVSATYDALRTDYDAMKVAYAETREALKEERVGRQLAVEANRELIAERDEVSKRYGELASDRDRLEAAYKDARAHLAEKVNMIELIRSALEVEGDVSTLTAAERIREEVLGNSVFLQGQQNRIDTLNGRVEEARRVAHQMIDAVYTTRRWHEQESMENDND